jgi:hypothetical protein
MVSWAFHFGTHGWALFDHCWHVEEEWRQWSIGGCVWCQSEIWGNLSHSHRPLDSMNWWKLWIFWHIRVECSLFSRCHKL